MDEREVVTAEVILREESPVNTSPATVTDMLQLALTKGLPVETLERLVALHERVSDRAAAAEFNGALAEFQDECPPITKTSMAQIVTTSGSKFSYTYAELGHIATTVRPLLHSRGFSYTWDSAIVDKMLTCTCTLRHVNGHKETASFTSPIETRAGMSEQQKMAAALSYAKRMSLIQVLGITTADPGTDGGNPATIDKAQAAELTRLIGDVGADVAKFLDYMHVDTIEEILRSDFNAARIALESKRKRGGRP